QMKDSGGHGDLLADYRVDGPVTDVFHGVGRLDREAGGRVDLVAHQLGVLDQTEQHRLLATGDREGGNALGDRAVEDLLALQVVGPDLLGVVLVGAFAGIRVHGQEGHVVRRVVGQHVHAARRPGAFHALGDLVLLDQPGRLAAVGDAVQVALEGREQQVLADALGYDEQGVL